MELSQARSPPRGGVCVPGRQVQPASFHHLGRTRAPSGLQEKTLGSFKTWRDEKSLEETQGLKARSGSSQPDYLLALQKQKGSCTLWLHSASASLSRPGAGHAAACSTARRPVLRGRVGRSPGPQRTAPGVGPAPSLGGKLWAPGLLRHRLPQRNRAAVAPGCSWPARTPG